MTSGPPVFTPYTGGPVVAFHSGMADWSGRSGYVPRTRTGYYGSRQFSGRRTGWLASKGGQGRFAAARAPPALFRPKSVNRSMQKNSGELKGLDTDLTIAGPLLVTTNTNVGILPLNLIEPGNGSFNRIGRKAFMKTLRISGGITFQGDTDPTTGVSDGSIMRMCVVWDKQPSGVIPVFSDIFGRTSQDGTETTSVLDNLRFDNTARFQVLRDKYLVSEPNNGGNGGTTNIMDFRYYCDEFIDLKNRTTVFSGDSDPVTIADISSGALYVVFRATNGVADKTDWSIAATMSARLRFTS